MGRDRSIEQFNIPESTDGARSIDLLPQGYRGVYYNPTRGKLVGKRVSDGKVIVGLHLIERQDDEIEITAKIRPLVANERIANRLKRNLKAQRRLLRELLR
jgi:hypothetical protein